MIEDSYNEKFPSYGQVWDLSKNNFNYMKLKPEIEELKINKKYLFIFGMKRSGKDLTGNILVNFLGYKRFAFADNVKIKFCESKNISLTHLEEFKSSLRDELVSFAESFRKKDPLYWINFLKNDIINSEENIVITDVRRIPEAELIQELKNKYGDNVQVLVIKRPKDNGGEFENDAETALTYMYLEHNNLISDIIINDSSFENFTTKLGSFIKKYNLQ